jgi:hypothetical protein
MGPDEFITPPVFVLEFLHQPHAQFFARSAGRAAVRQRGWLARHVPRAPGLHKPGVMHLR